MVTLNLGFIFLLCNKFGFNPKYIRVSQQKGPYSLTYFQNTSAWRCTNGFLLWLSPACGNDGGRNQFVQCQAEAIRKSSNEYGAFCHHMPTSHIYKRLSSKLTEHKSARTVHLRAMNKRNLLKLACNKEASLFNRYHYTCNIQALNTSYKTSWSSKCSV